MKPRKRNLDQAASEGTEHGDRLAHVRPIAHDEDERPSSEDRGYGSTIFTRGTVPMPRFLGGAKRKRKRP